MRSELSRPLPVNAVGPRGDEIIVEADAEERARLAARFGLLAIESLRCRFRLLPSLAGTVTAHGNLTATVVQTCIVSLEDFVADVVEAFDVRFVPAGSENDEMDPEEADDIGYEAGVIDLGEATAQQLALALDPYPRKPGAALPDDRDTGEPHPFSILRDRLRRQR